MQRDSQLEHLITEETTYQQNTLSLIASENYASNAVRAATGSVLTNKYAEGYPGKRYYAGCKIVDQIELLAQERCKKLFGVDHANVQPHAGSQANMAVYLATLKPGDTILGMSLAHGGHLTHGHSVNFSGQLYNIISYGVNKETELIDYNAVQELAEKYKPKLIIAGASAYSRIIDFKHFSEIANSVGALLFADIAHIAGLVVAGLHINPATYADFISSTTHKTLRGPRGGIVLCKEKHAQALDRAIMPGSQGGPFMNSIAAKAIAFFEASQPSFIEYQKQVIKNAQTLARELSQNGFRIVTGGTDNHLFIVDLQQKITGLEAERILESIGIHASRSTIPFDPQKPWITSGIRFGTPAVTTREMKEKEMSLIAEYVSAALAQPTNTALLNDLKKKVQILCKQFLPPF